MQIFDTLSFSWRLFRRNRGRALLSFGGIFVGSFFLALFLSFAEGLRQNVLEPVAKELSTETFVAVPKPIVFGNLFDPRRYLENTAAAGVSAETLQTIRSWPEVGAAAPEFHIPFPVATEAQVIFGINIALDSLVSGYTEESVRQFLSPGQTFNGDEEILPVLVSPLLVEIYNSTLADLLPGAGRKTLDDFLGRSLEFTFGKTNYFSLLHSFPAGIAPAEKKAKIVGFAPFLSPFTLGIPASFAADIRAKYEQIPPAQIQPSAVLIHPRSPQDAPALRQKLSGLELQVKNSPFGFDQIRFLFNGFESLLIGAAAIIFLLALLLLVVTLLAAVREQRRNIGILRALGASSENIRNIFFGQGLGVVFVASCSGFALALGSAAGLNHFLLKILPVTAVPIRSFFLFAPLFFCAALLLLLCISAGVIFFPARRAARLRPLTALSTGSL